MKSSSSCCMSVLALMLPSSASSFAWPPQSKSRHSTLTTTRHQSTRTRHGREVADVYNLDLERNKNGTVDYGPMMASSQDPSAHTMSHVHDDDLTPTETLAFLEQDPSDDSESATKQKLLEGYFAYQSLLSSVDSYQPILIEQEAREVMSASLEPSDANNELTDDSSILSTIPSPVASSLSIPILSDVWKARLLLLLSAALYGTNFTFVKSLDESMSVGLSSTLRFGFAALVMLPCLFAPIDDELKVLPTSTKEDDEMKSDESGGQRNSDNNLLSKLLGGEETTRLRVTLVGMEIGMYASIGYIAQAVGLKTTSASNSAFICSMAVVIVPILDYIVGKELLRRQVIGACLAAFGVYALELGGQQNTLSDGDLMSMVQPLMFGLGFWRMEAAMEKYPTEAGRLAAAQLLMVFLMSLSYLVCLSSPMMGDGACNVLPTASELMTWLQDPHILGMLFWTGIVTTAFTIFMETLALKTLSAAETTVIFSTEPLFGAAFAAAFANESLGTEAAIGAAFIIGGCLVSGMDFGQFFKGDEVADIEATDA